MGVGFRVSSFFLFFFFVNYFMSLELKELDNMQDGMKREIFI